MIYVRTTVNGQEVRTVIVDDCFFSDCPVCGEQTSVDFDTLVQIINDGELEGTSVLCDPCSEKYQQEKKPKLSIVK